MKLTELNSLTERKNFLGIKRDIEKTINKYEDDAKEVRIDVVLSYENLSNKLFDKLDKMKDEQENDDLSPKTDFDAMKKRIVGLQGKFMEFIKKYKDNEFQKETIKKLIKHIREIIVKLEDALYDVESLEDAIGEMEKVNKQAQKTTLKRKIPYGISQDIKTKKHKINKYFFV